MPIETGRRIKIVQSAAIVFEIQLKGSFTFILLFPALLYVVIYTIGERCEAKGLYRNVNSKLSDRKPQQELMED